MCIYIQIYLFVELYNVSKGYDRLCNSDVFHLIQVNIHKWIEREICLVSIYLCTSKSIFIYIYIKLTPPRDTTDFVIPASFTEFRWKYINQYTYYTNRYLSTCIYQHEDLDLDVTYPYYFIKRLRDTRLTLIQVKIHEYIYIYY